MVWTPRSSSSVDLSLLLQDTKERQVYKSIRTPFCAHAESTSRFAEQLNETFINFVLDHIESSEHEQIPDLFVNLILAFNLHFGIPEENDVMKALADRKTSKVFTEKIMLLVNRGGGFIQPTASLA